MSYHFGKSDIKLRFFLYILGTVTYGTFCKKFRKSLCPEQHSSGSLLYRVKITRPVKFSERKFIEDPLILALLPSAHFKVKIARSRLFFRFYLVPISRSQIIVTSAFFFLWKLELPFSREGNDIEELNNFRW